MITIKNITDMNNTISKNLLKIKNLGSIDAVVGIPRSGLLPATIISTHLQLPLSDIENYKNNKFYLPSGKVVELGKNKNILLVDDSILNGNAMEKALSYISTFNFDDKIIKFVVWATDKNKNKKELLDLYCDICPTPRAFQWNLWKHNRLKYWALDMDGVICRDPTNEENDRGTRYLNFIENATPLYPVNSAVKYIITGRLEKFRKPTEKWLKRHNIKYDKLIMKQTDNKNDHAENKASIINTLNDIELYIESSKKQAINISKLVSIPVWCTETQKVYTK